jgi:bacterioferritin-associated ferredoxin
MFVCVCNAVTDSDIRKAVDKGVRNMRQLSQTTGCGTTCGCCKAMAVETLQQAVSEIRECRLSLPIMQIA